MIAWNCCRTCLSTQTLYPIFSSPEHSEKYSNIIFTTTGIKVDLNDTLPQQICSGCINFINESVKFRRKCEESHKTLISKVKHEPTTDIKVETYIFEVGNDKATEIDISDYLETTDDHFQDDDDHIPLHSLQYSNNYREKAEDISTDNLLETKTEEQKVDQSLEVNNVRITEVKIEIERVTTTNSHTRRTKTENRKERNVKSKKEKVRKELISNVKVKTTNPCKERRKKENQKEKEDKSKTENAREEIECEHCHKILSSRLSLRNHYKIHTGFDVVCEHCGKKFITRRLLLMHCRAKHGYEKTDKCSYCDYRASNAEQVKIHERLHTGEKPYVCKECNTGFHRQSNYLQHIAIHLPEKTVQCDQCPARFKSVTLMRIHKNRHRAPQYFFRCTVCDKSFARRRNVFRHLQRIHGLPPDVQHMERKKIS